jgi:hypothetical protein
MLLQQCLQQNPGAGQYPIWYKENEFHQAVVANGQFM